MQKLEDLISATQWAHQQQLTPATGGNFSLRHSTNSCLITASGVDKGKLTAEDFIEINWQDNTVIGKGKPSAETALHTMLYQLDENIYTVLHTHSVNATVLSSLSSHDEFVFYDWEMKKVLAGVSSHEAKVGLAVFDNDQDIPALAQRVKQRWQKNPLQWGLLVRGHGLYSWGQTIQQAQLQLEGLEFLFQAEVLRRQLER